jgi:hypothetical protein
MIRICCLPTTSSSPVEKQSQLPGAQEVMELKKTQARQNTYLCLGSVC